MFNGNNQLQIADVITNLRNFSIAVIKFFKTSKVGISY